MLRSCENGRLGCFCLLSGSAGVHGFEDRVVLGRSGRAVSVYTLCVYSLDVQ